MGWNGFMPGVSRESSCAFANRRIAPQTGEGKDDDPKMTQAQLNELVVIGELAIGSIGL